MPAAIASCRSADVCGLSRPTRKKPPQSAYLRAGGFTLRAVSLCRPGLIPNHRERRHRRATRLPAHADTVDSSRRQRIQQRTAWQGLSAPCRPADRSGALAGTEHQRCGGLAASSLTVPQEAKGSDCAGTIRIGSVPESAQSVGQRISEAHPGADGAKLSHTIAQPAAPVGL